LVHRKEYQKHLVGKNKTDLKRHSKEEVLPTRMSPRKKHFWFAMGLVVFGLCLALGTSMFITHADRNSALARLPDVPDLTRNTKTLMAKITSADRVVRETIKERGPDAQFGQKAGELGRLYQANFFYDQALLCYKLAMEFDSKNPHWPYLLASVLQERGENESARGLLERTIDLAPSYSPAMLKLADSYFKTGNTEKATLYYERRLKLLPGDPYALLGLGRIALERSEWGTAQACLQRALQTDPSFGDAHRFLATVHEHFGRFEEMKLALDRAAHCPPFYQAPDPWIDTLADLCYETEQLLVLGSKALTRGDIEAALNKFYRRAMELDPKNPKVLLAMGKGMFIAGQRKEASQFFQETISLDPKSDEAYFQLGVILQSEKKLEEAEQMFLKAVVLQPNNANIYNNLGVALLEQKRYEDAIKYLKQALDIEPEHINARYNLGMSFWASGRTQESIEQYRQVLRLKPEWATAASSLAWILATDKNASYRNGEEAVRWALVACRGDGRNNPEYLDTLAAAYAEAGDFEQAVQTAERSLKMAQAKGDTALSNDVQKRLLLYKSARAFRH
jgi:tetratricopeptide (TPR) repeat protein